VLIDDLIGWDIGVDCTFWYIRSNMLIGGINNQVN